MITDYKQSVSGVFGASVPPVKCLGSPSHGRLGASVPPGGCFSSPRQVPRFPLVGAWVPPVRCPGSP
jgi:hypothetical protein